MLKVIFLAALFALGSIIAARAQEGGPAHPEALREFVMTKSGETVRIWTFVDCADPKTIPGAFGTAANGLIVAKRATELQCGNPEQPVVQIFYTPREGFYGEDDAVVRGPRGQEVQIKIRVTQPPSVAEAPPSRVQVAPQAPAKAAAANARPKIAPQPSRGAARPSREAARPSRSAARPSRSAARPRVAAAGARSCARKRGEATIVRLLRCELAGGKTGNRRRVVLQAPDSAR